MDLGLAGKTAVVTGASKGIGLAVTQALVAEGARVAAGARSPGALAGLDGVHPCVSNFCKALSKEVGPRGVRVNTVSPGPVETDLWLGDQGVAATVAGATNLDPRAVVEQAAAGTSTGRFTRPDEVADLVVLLAGNRGANVTGSDILIDGGLVQTL